MIDSEGDRLAQRGGRVKLPQTTPGQTSSYSHTHTGTLFQETDWKSTAYRDAEAPSHCVAVHIVSQHPLPLLLSFYLTAWHSASFTLSLMSLFDTSIKAGFSGTIILLRSSIAKKAKERESKKGLFFCLAAYISSRRWQKDFHRINREQEKVNRARLWEILQTWKNPSCLSNFSALLFGLLECSSIHYIQRFDMTGTLAQLANRVI